MIATYALSMKTCCRSPIWGKLHNKKRYPNEKQAYNNPKIFSGPPKGLLGLSLWSQELFQYFFSKFIYCLFQSRIAII